MNNKGNKRQIDAQHTDNSAIGTGRRSLLRAALAGGAAIGTGIGLGTGSATATPRTPHPPGTRNWPWPPLTPAQAEAKLWEGNAAWKIQGQANPRQYETDRRLLVTNQTPWAMIVSCIDSRVPPELVFDQGLGDLFVARTAGQVLDGAVYGSTLYGVQEKDVPLIVVLGHQSCGAVKLAMHVVDGDPLPPDTSPRLLWLAEKIRPSIDPDKNSPDRENRAINANVRRIRDEILLEGPVAEKVRQGHLRVIGARYELDTWGVTKL
ncbi:carbonic anhydrase [Streptomyces sp. NPDC004134]|uniref:carbonic anhydrase n=1 Tax=Streptomyces sp. NPDC004134 TaxID=3364691 RepID=UPI003699AF5C